MSNNIIEMQMFASHGWRFGGGGGQVANFIMLLSSWLLSPEREQRGCYVVNVLFMPRLQSISLKRVRCVQFYCMQTHVTHSYIYRDTHSNMHTYNALHANTHTHASVFICALANADTLRYSSAPTHAHAHTHTKPNMFFRRESKLFYQA